MGVYELSGAGSVKTGRTLYTSMNAGNQYGAMVPIASATGTGTTGGELITFTNIPQTYQDLFVSVYGIQTNTSGTISIAFNGATGTPYSYTYLTGDGTSALSSRVVNTNPLLYINLTTSTYPVTGQYHILNYANTTTYKTALSRYALDKNGSGFTWLGTGLWSNISAISSLTISSNFGGSNWTTDTRVTLYGIRAVSS